MRGMSGRVVHFEVPFDDPERARTFYGETFGWSFVEGPSKHHLSVQPGPVGDDGRPEERGAINGGLLRRESPSDRPMLTIEVDDLDAAMERLESFGGQVVMPPQQVVGFGRTAYFKDTEGNLMGLWEPLA